MKKKKEIFIVFVLFFVLQIFLQFINGAFRSEFGGHPDEVGHYVTGLMVKEFIESGNWANPIQFAEQYYLHYPKVAFGHWPPFFYLAQAVWMILFSASQLSIISMMAFLTAILSTLIYYTVKTRTNLIYGISAGVLFLFTPLIQNYSIMVMAEILVALLCFAATLVWSKYMDSPNVKNAIAFSILSSLAIMTKGNALLMALLPPLSIVITRKFRILQNRSLWYIPIMVVLICSLFYLKTLDMVQNGWEEEISYFQYIKEALPFYAFNLVKVLGYGLSVVVLSGLIFIFRDKKKEISLWVSFSALIISVLIFHCFVPSGFARRHLVTAIPPLIVILIVGIAVLEKMIDSKFNQKPRIVLLLFIFFIFATETFNLREKEWSGFRQIAKDLIEQTSSPNSVFIVSSDSTGEGMFVSEVALLQSRPKHIILRSSKTFSTSRWSGAQYRARFSATDQIKDYLDSIPVEYLIVDKSIKEKRKRKHNRQIEEMVVSYKNDFEFIGTYPIIRDQLIYQNAIDVYRLKAESYERSNKININMENMLGREIKEK